MRAVEEMNRERGRKTLARILQKIRLGKKITELEYVKLRNLNMTHEEETKKIKFEKRR